jgi:hypothetical protein
MRNIFDTVFLVTLFTAALLSVLADSTVAQSAEAANLECPYFAIQVLDRQTGRGVPLVELKTTNHLRYVTDSHGVVAFREPGLMDREVFFHVESHGYRFPKDGFGYRGTRLKTTPGTTATIQIGRINIAERLYRVTGQGIYRDSILTGRPVPLEHPALNAQVTGQDSVYTCIYGDKLFWLWGDTNRPSYPLGHFWTAGAVSDLPQHGGLDPAVGVDLEYFIDENGFSRPIARLKEKGLVWLDGLLTVADDEGTERLVAGYARMKDLGTAYERGLMVFNDETESFEPVVRSDADLLPYTNCGHAVPVQVEGQDYYYFATQFPLTVQMRVKAQWDDVMDPNRYEALTALQPGTLESRGPCRWIAFGDLMGGDRSTKASVIKALAQEKEHTYLYDIETGKRLSPHGGSVYFNAYRQRWVMVVVQSSGDRSYLGEVWYAEADTPVGPWAYARQIVTHNKYSFYNPAQHPYFAQDDGRTIYFEGTYCTSFSRDVNEATPRYDYNQIMYRLSLDDPRLVLPTPVYRIQTEDGTNTYRLGGGIDALDRAPSIPFFAIEPDRAGSDLIPIYAQNTKLTAERPGAASAPLFFALPATETSGENTRVVDLYEYRHGDSGQYLYDTDPQLKEKGWKRVEKPLCRVWKTPDGPLLLDRGTGPAQGR